MLSDSRSLADALDAAAQLAKWQPKVAALEAAAAEVVSAAASPSAGSTDTWAAVVADIEVDTRTGKIVVKDLYGPSSRPRHPPEQLHNQMIGCLVTGASRALNEQVVVRHKKGDEPRLGGYPTIRFKDSPTVTHGRRPTARPQPRGVGRADLVPSPAAIANAFFDATGVRIRESPMTPARVRAALKAAGH